MNVLLITLVLPFVIGIAWETWCRRRDRMTWRAPGQSIDVGGHQLHVRSWGEGATVILFEADEGAWSTHWGDLPERFAPDARVVAYDRAGLGWSDTGPAPRDVETLARELHQLLIKMVPDPARRVILVGHGTGVHVARMYAHRYPFETAGLVFVDGHPDTLADRLRREQVPAPAVSSFAVKVQGLLSQVGLLRLLERSNSPNAHLPLPERQRQMLDALELDPRVRRGAGEELSAEARTLEQLARLRDEHDTPTRVIVAGQTLAEGLTPPGYPREEFNRVWAEESAKLARTSACAEVIRVEDGDHLLQLRATDLVEQAIRSVLTNADEADPIS